MKKVKSYFVFFLSLNVFILPSFGQTKKNIKPVLASVHKAGVVASVERSGHLQLVRTV